MHILYIHGLDSEPNAEKLALIEERGHQTFSLHLDYRKDKSCYWRLRDLAMEASVDFIVGSSLGGYFGYWLGQELLIPQLLFNPAMPFRSVHVPAPNASDEEEKEVSSWVVLGEDDDIIPSNLNREFFKGKDCARVITCEWLGHRIDLVTFGEMIRWAGL